MLRNVFSKVSLFIMIQLMLTHILPAQFAAPVPLGLGTSADFILFDLENDGDLDVISHGQKQVNYYINQIAEGNGWVAKELEISLAGGNVGDLDFADLNGDNINDLVVFGGYAENSSVSWYAYQQPQETFLLQDSIQYFGYQECWAIISTDFVDVDQDNDLDIIFSQGWSPLLLKNTDGLGTLEKAYDFGNIICRGAGVRDLNKDGAVDVLLVNGKQSIAFHNDGSGTYSQKATAYSDAQETDALATFINDSVFVHYKNFGTNGIIYEFSGDSILLLNNDQYDYQDRLLYHDFNKDGTLDQIRYTWPTVSSFLEFAQYNPESLKFDRTISFYDFNKGIDEVQVADFDQDGWDDIIFLQDGALFWMENQAALPSISGTAYIDANGNGLRDQGDYPLRNARITSPEADHYTYTNEAGKYTFFALPGTYSIRANVFNTNLQLVTNNTFTTELANGEQVNGVDFGFVYLTEIKDLDISLFSRFTRCDNEVLFFINYENKGTLPASGQIILSLAENTSFVSATSLPTVTTEDQIIWDYTNLGPGSKAKIDLRLLMPSADFIDEVLHFTATIKDQVNDFENIAEYESSLRCSYDPNDKQVVPVGQGPDHLTLLEEDILEYLIRFQNTGNDTAFNVSITDALDPLLNINSFEVTSASHPYRAEINERILSFFFDDILLPDSTTNLEKSQGYIRFRIRTQDNIADGDVVRNQAKIYFDRNAPITTNEVRNTFVSFICSEIRSEIDQTICAGESYLGYQQSGTYTDSLTSVNGCDSVRVLQLQVLPYEEMEIDTAICVGDSLFGYGEPGRYIDTLAGTTCSLIRTLELAYLAEGDAGCLVAVKDPEASFFSLYPNPVQEKLTIQLENVAKEGLHLRLLDPHGKVLIHRKELASEQLELPVHDLAPGLYYLQITRAGRSSVKKVLKMK